MQTLLDFYKQGRADGSFEHGIEMALRAMLTSPAFLFRIEQAPGTVRLKADPTDVSATGDQTDLRLTTIDCGLSTLDS